MIVIKASTDDSIVLRDALGQVGEVRVSHISVQGAGRVSLAFDCPGVVVQRPGKHNLKYLATRGASGAPGAPGAPGALGAPGAPGA